MKLKSTLIAAFCTVAVGGTGSMILQPPIAHAQVNRDRRPTQAAQGEGVLTDRDPRADIAIRTEPSARSRILGYGFVGDEVDIFKETRGSGESWYQVRVRGSREIGWVPGSNLRLLDNVGSSGDRGEPIRLSQRGRGTFEISGRSPWEIAQVSVTVDDGDQAELAFRLDDNRLIRLSGDVDRRDAYSLTIDIEASGNADASGTVDIEYGANNSINQIFGDGRLDGQPFSISFDGDRRSENFEDFDQKWIGRNVDDAVRELRADGWKVVESRRNSIQLERDRREMDIKFHPRNRSVLSVRMAD